MILKHLNIVDQHLMIQQFPNISIKTRILLLLV